MMYTTEVIQRKWTAHSTQTYYSDVQYWILRVGIFSIR